MGEQSNRTLQRRKAPSGPPPTPALAAPERTSHDHTRGSGTDDPAAPAPIAAREPAAKPAQPAAKPAQWAAQPAAKPPQPSAKPAQPSWLKVIATTVRLWLRRHHGFSFRRPIVMLVAIVLAAAAAGGVTIALSRHAATGRSASAGASASQGAGGVGTAAAVTRQAAVWVAQQVSRDALVACDPAMCTVLQARGFPVANLLVLGAAAPDPLGSDVIVATAAVRDRLGTRLRQVYAPTAIASFGSGTARIDILAVAPDGTTLYLAALRSDQQARRIAGAELLRNPRIHAAGAPRRQLLAGQVDSRLLITLAALSARHSLNVVAFGGMAPGAAPRVPLREMYVSGTAGITGNAAELRSIRAFLLARRAPYLPARVELVRLTGGIAALRITFGAPSPLGLLGTPVAGSSSSHR